MSTTKLTRSESGRLGYLASIEISTKLNVERINKYYTDPKLCKNCQIIIAYQTYKAKNKGNGRYERRKRYAEGKSY